MLTDQLSVFGPEDTLAVDSPQKPDQQKGIDHTEEWEVDVLRDLVEVSLHVVNGAAEVGVESLGDGLAGGGEGTGCSLVHDNMISDPEKSN